MKREDVIKKIEEIKNLSKNNSGIAYLSAATAWLLMDRIDQLFEQAAPEQKVIDSDDGWKARAEKAERLLKDIGDALGIGEQARTPDTILFNVKNAVRRSRCLSLIEEHHTILVKDDDGDDMPEQLLSWGEDPEKYIETYRAVIASPTCNHPNAQTPVSGCSGQAEIPKPRF